MVHETIGRGHTPPWRHALTAVAVGLLWLGCAKTRPPDAPADGSAEVVLALTQAPATVGCVAITIASDHTDRRSFDLGPGKPTSFTLGRLPVGVLVFSVDAFASSCAVVAPTSIPVSSGGPISVTLKAGTNGTIVVLLEPSSQATLAVGFDPNAAPICAAGGSACVQDADCCSQRCGAKDASPAGVPLCRADEPPSPTTTRLQYHPDQLKELGGRASYPGFDGDLMFVAFPHNLDDKGEDRTAQAVRARYVVPALRATGFEAVDRVVTPAGPPQVLPGGNFAELARTSCENEAADVAGAVGGTSRVLCAYLANLGQMQPPSAVGALVTASLGMPAERLRDEVNQPLQYWFFSQRERGVPVEHKGVMAIQHGERRRVSSVFGSVVSNTRIVNQVGLNSDTALQRAQAILFKLEGLVQAPPMLVTGGRLVQLVLLPYGAPSDDPKSGVTALRFAYRARIGAALPPTGQGQPELVSYLVWVDAGNGDLLKYVPESANATTYSRTFSPWCRDPSESASACYVGLQINDSVTDPGKFILSNAGLSVSYLGNTPIAPPEKLFPAPVVPGEACNSSATFRAASAFAQLERARKTIQNGGRFIGFPRAVTVTIDDLGLQDSANFNLLTLSFVKGTLANPATSTASDCTHTSGELLNGAQDATILAHEYAHLATLQLQNGNPSNNCGESDCPILNPYNRRFFHDYSDGLAALLAETPCIGGWTAKNTTANLTGVATAVPTRDEVARACGDSREDFRLPRLLFADPSAAATFAATDAFKDGAKAATTPPIRTDAFPVHRVGSPGEYGDGQIVGAALWHLWQGIKSQARLAGGLPVWGRINEALWSTGFSNTVCPFSDTSCDMNVFRAGREMLLHLTDAWLANDGSQSLNKLLSAFARAGLFLTPPACLDGALGDKSTPLDPQFCPDGKQGGDAIIDIDDGDASDFTEKLGIRLADDDFVRNGDAPKFRIWTGVPYAFLPGGTTATPAVPLCNDHFQVYIRPQGGGWQKDVTGSTSPGSPCYAEAVMTSGALFKVDPTIGFTTVEYKVTTWRGAATEPMPATSDVRDSMAPGAGLWSAPVTMPASPSSAAINPSVFFVTNSGAPP